MWGPDLFVTEVTMEGNIIDKYRGFTDGVMVVSVWMKHDQHDLQKHKIRLNTVLAMCHVKSVHGLCFSSFTDGSTHSFCSCPSYCFSIASMYFCVYSTILDSNDDRTLRDT